MNILYSLAAILVYVTIQVDYVSAIQCYTCKTEMDPGCADSPPSSIYLKNCSDIKDGPKYVACRKMENWVDFKVLDQQPTRRVIRQCAIDVDPDRLCYYRAGFGGRANVCDCLEDRCNSASLPFSSLLTLAVTLVVFLKTIA